MLTPDEIEAAVKYVSTLAKIPKEAVKRAYKNSDEAILSSKDLNDVLIKEWLSTAVSNSLTYYCYFTTKKYEHAIIVRLLFSDT